MSLSSFYTEETKPQSRLSSFTCLSALCCGHAGTTALSEQEWDGLRSSSFNQLGQGQFPGNSHGQSRKTNTSVSSIGYFQPKNGSKLQTSRARQEQEPNQNQKQSQEKGTTGGYRVGTSGPCRPSFSPCWQSSYRHYCRRSLVALRLGIQSTPTHVSKCTFPPSVSHTL